MIANMGTIDGVVRVVVGVTAVLVSVFFCWGSLVGTIVGILLLALAGVIFVTAAIGYSPMYRVLNISTNPTIHRIAKSEAELVTHR